MTNYGDKDFIGFRFKGRHSSEFGIIRVSDGSRYNEDLLPAVQDKTIQVPGGDGTYYFGSYYTQRIFPIQIAFDGITELQFRQLRQWISDKTPGRLIFDERPYKYYTAKISSTAQTLKYICFEEDGKRVYKGEGTLNFVCYYPFAKSVYKFLDSYYDNYGTSNQKPKEDYGNIDEWKESSGMRQSNSTGILDWARTYDEGYFYLSGSEWQALLASGTYSKATGKALIRYWNCGDVETDFKLILNFWYKNEQSQWDVDYRGGKIKIYLDSIQNSPKMVLDLSKYETIPDCLVVDTKNNSIYDYFNPSELYTGLLIEGDFFKLPITKQGEQRDIYVICDKALVFNYWDEATGRFDNSIIDNRGSINLEYDYLYF